MEFIGPFDTVSFVSGAATGLMVALFVFVGWLQWIGRK